MYYAISTAVFFLPRLLFHSNAFLLLTISDENIFFSSSDRKNVFFPPMTEIVRHIMIILFFASSLFSLFIESSSHDDLFINFYRSTAKEENLLISIKGRKYDFKPTFLLFPFTKQWQKFIEASTTEN